MIMAAPDISALGSAADVFSPTHSLPQIRAIHKTIHAQLDEKASRLRSQVGGSYRELLGTADAIVRMRERNDEVQGVLGGMEARCGRGIVWSKVNGMGGFVGAAGDERTSGPLATTGETARLQLLEACMLAASRVLRGGSVGGALEGMGSGDRVVLATKLLILARLLVKSFANGAEDEQTRVTLETAEKNRLALRRKLSRCVEKVLERCGEEGADGEEGEGEEEGESGRADILKALAAYSLATNSGARDALKHFLGMREKAARRALEIGGDDRREPGARGVLVALNLYTKTILDVQAIVPSGLSDALASLKKRALLADATLRQLEVLRLDIYERWCGEDVQLFTPFIRHDDLDGRQAREMLMGWADTERGVVVGSLERVLGAMSEFEGVVELRTKLIQLWVRDGTWSRGFNPAEMLERLRRTINARLLAIIETKVNKLHLVGSEVAATLDAWREGGGGGGGPGHQQGLWDESTYDMDLSNGVAAFLQDAMSRMYGRDDAVSKAIGCYNSWRHVIDDVGGVVEHLRNQRWDDDIDDVEDDDAIEARQEGLSRDDPAALQERLDATLEKAFGALEERFATLWREREDGSESGRMAMFLVRVLRDLRTALPKLECVGDFGLEMVPSLHGRIAREVALEPLDGFVRGALARKTAVGRALWEGTPEMPTVPTPGMFMFLRDLSKAMGAAGMDLWSPTAVKVLKGLVSKGLCEAWPGALEELTRAAKQDQTADDNKDDEGTDVEAGGGEGEGGTGSDDRVLDEQRRDLLVQWFFDVSYLRCCFDSPDGGSEGWGLLMEAVYEKTGLEGGAPRQHLIKASQEYWKRTSLLFGLLA